MISRRLAFALLVCATVAMAATAVYAASPSLLIIEGPNERGEHPLTVGTGTLKVDVYGQGIIGFGALHAVMRFVNPGGADASGFLISTTGGNPTFGDQAITCNTALSTSIFPIYVSDAARPHYRETAGFVALDGDVNLVEKTWLLSVTYDYNVGPDGAGTYSLDADTLLTVVAGSGGSIPCTVLPGSATFAKWPVFGDANGDCRVDVIDMIFIRDRFGRSVSSGDNCKADVNDDGTINMLDMVYVRSRLFDTCSMGTSPAFPTSFVPATIGAGATTLPITVQPGGLDVQDVVTLTFGGVVQKSNFHLGATTMHVSTIPGENLLTIQAISEGVNEHDGYVDVTVAVPGATPKEVQQVSIPVGGSATLKITRAGTSPAWPTSFAPATMAESTTLLAITVQPGGLDVQDVVTFTFGGFIQESNFHLGSTTIHVSTIHGENRLVVDAISEGVNEHDGYVDVVVAVPGATPMVQRVSIPVGGSATLTIARP